MSDKRVSERRRTVRFNASRVIPQGEKGTAGFSPHEAEVSEDEDLANSVALLGEGSRGVGRGSTVEVLKEGAKSECQSVACVRANGSIGGRCQLGSKARLTCWQLVIPVWFLRLDATIETSSVSELDQGGQCSEQTPKQG